MLTDCSKEPFMFHINITQLPWQSREKKWELEEKDLRKQCQLGICGSPLLHLHKQEQEQSLDSLPCSSSRVQAGGVPIFSSERI